MKKKDRPILKDWSFFIFLILFGAIYLTAGGFLPFVGEKQVQSFAGLPQISDLGEDVVIAEAELEDVEGTELSEYAPETGDCAEKASEDAGNIADDPVEDHPDSDADASGETVYRTVEDDYFADAVFIGDSRTVGMYEYGGLEEISTFYCSTGLTVYKMFDSQIVEVPGQKKKQTVEEALSQKQFSAIYLMIGINEMGTGTVDSFTEVYQSCVEHLQELQPDAVIYLQGIMKVTAARSAQEDYINNEGIEARNAKIAELADGERIFYLDVNPLICDETGGMVEDYTYDGVHLKAQYIPIWKDYLKSHVIQREEKYKGCSP